MEIDKVRLYSGQLVRGNETPTTSKSDKPVDEKTAQPVDRLGLSADVRKVAQIKQKVVAAEEVRVDKVEQLRNAIANGEFEVKPSNIADKMIDELV